jgi:hypothetical protein
MKGLFIFAFPLKYFLQKTIFDGSRLTARVTCAGADGGTPSNEKKAEAWQMPKNAQTPQRQSARFVSQQNI